jgi:NAD(P)-dependent dehydrogenase (short-subunit alcohol dehydrogenase family)
MTKTALITGATGGLGKATSQHLLDHGWQVVVADFDREALSVLEGQKGVIPVFIDVTDTSSVEAASAQVSQSTAWTLLSISPVFLLWAPWWRWTRPS